MGNTPKKIKVRGAKVHNLKNINVDIPLNQIVDKDSKYLLEPSL